MMSLSLKLIVRLAGFEDVQASRFMDWKWNMEFQRPTNFCSCCSAELTFAEPEIISYATSVDLHYEALC